MWWGPWWGGAAHLFVSGHLGCGVLDVDSYLCSYRNASPAAPSFAYAPAWHMGPRCLGRCIRVQRCFYLVFIAF